jgi:diguanylate cyclase (GGDEF)-like protein
MREKHREKTAESPMMTKEGKEQLYYYSLKKMAEVNVEHSKVELTGLNDIKAFYYMSNELIKKNPDRKFAVIRMDIYRFKTVNEFCGRTEGDNFLKYIADCFRKYESDTAIAAHLRADIFAICMPFREQDELVSVVKDINQRISAYPLSCKVLPAFGICVSSGDMDASLMCDYADLALQNIKGKAYALYEFYDEQMREELLHEKRIENNVAEALRDNEFTVYIQPKVDMRSGKIVGGEALVRWISPKDGFIYPDMFVPVLEKSGYIVDVDDYVCEKVFEAVRAWIDKGISPVPISINISRIHVYQETFCRMLCDLSRRYMVAPKYIVLEVTESMFTEYADKLYRNIEFLQHQGFKFSMDDFGAGYSSLNMLKNEPVDEVKIDRFFLKDIEKKKSQIVIRNVVNMIKELGLDMIVEGIETEEQAQLLMSYGCYYAQGFYYYKPMPVEEFEKELERTCHTR